MSSPPCGEAAEAPDQGLFGNTSAGHLDRSCHPCVELSVYRPGENETNKQKNHDGGDEQSGK